MSGPTCTIIAGPNGAGKTTFALVFMREIGYRNFVNADLIAAGISPLAPEREWIAAGHSAVRQFHYPALQLMNFVDSWK